MTFFEPSPVFLAFIFVQKFVVFEVLGVLALLRLIVGSGIARIPALLTLAICCAAVLTTFAPALNMHTADLYPAAARLMVKGGGTLLPLVTSAIFALCLLMPTRRWRWIDIVHCVGIIAYLGLWLVTRF